MKILTTIKEHAVAVYANVVQFIKDVRDSNKSWVAIALVSDVCVIAILTVCVLAHPVSMLILGTAVAVSSWVNKRCD